MKDWLLIIDCEGDRSVTAYDTREEADKNGVTMVKAYGDKVKVSSISLKEAEKTGIVLGPPCMKCSGTGYMWTQCDECEDGVVDDGCICNGSGEGMADGTTCPACKGKGSNSHKCDKCEYIDEFDDWMMEVECDHCKGSGGEPGEKIC